MPKYVTLFNYTPKGIEEAKTSPERVASARAAIESVGGKWANLWSRWVVTTV